MKSRFQVNNQVFSKMSKICSCGTIAEKGLAIDSIHHNNVEYVITGFGYFGKGNERSYANPVVDLSTYKGELEPLKYGLHWKEADLGLRGREYTGMLIKCKGRRLVFVGEPVEFECGSNIEQLSLF